MLTSAKEIASHFVTKRLQHNHEARTLRTYKSKNLHEDTISMFLSQPHKSVGSSQAKSMRAKVTNSILDEIDNLRVSIDKVHVRCLSAIEGFVMMNL